MDASFNVTILIVFLIVILSNNQWDTTSQKEHQTETLDFHLENKTQHTQTQGTLSASLPFLRPELYNIITNWYNSGKWQNKISSLSIIAKALRKKYLSNAVKPTKLLLFLTLLILSQANDIETNPGPSNDSTKYLCGTCDKTVTWEHKGIVCETCDQWFHINCQNVNSNSYEVLNDSMISWHCIICNNPNYSTLPFDLYSISLSNTFECLNQSTNVQTDNQQTPSKSFRPSHQSTPIRIKKHKIKSSAPLRIINVNFQSIKKKQHLVHNLIENMKPDIVLGTETWLDPSIKDSEIFPDGFKIYRKDRLGRQGGGVLIAIKNDYISDQVEDLSPNNNCEIIWAKLEIAGKKTLYISSFYNPKTSDENNLNWFDISVKKACRAKNAAILIGGDFNLPGWDWENKILKPGTSYSKQHYSLGNTLDDMGLVQLINQPTRNGNVLDLMITNLPNQVPRTEVIPGISDHHAVFIEFNITPSKIKTIPRNIPLYGKANWTTLKSEINNLFLDLKTKAESSSVEALWILFKSQLNKLINEHIPHKIVKSNKIKSPWITLETKKLIKKRDRLYRKMKKSGDEKMRKKFKDLKHKIQRQLRQSYWQYIEDIVTPNTEGNSFGNMKKFWSYIKHKKTDYIGVSSLKKEGKVLTDPSEKANALNSQFQSVFSENFDISYEQFKNDKYMPETIEYPPMPDITITKNGITKQLLQLDPKKACGPDEIKPRILKELAHEISPILSLIYQKSINTGEVPSDWRTAHVSPIYKKGSKYNPENYRPISLTCICCKILEHVVTSSIMTHADKQNILYPLQHGFRKKRSCESQLLEFIDDVSKNIDKGTQSDVLIMDFSKAFDKVSHNLLVHKLHKYGIQGNTNRWIQNFLLNRTQAVVLEGEKSDYVPVRSGVPQGSVLGPSLFLFYINDMPIGINGTVRLFADDTIAYLAIKSNSDCQSLQNDLEKLSVWENKWKMAFHPDKCNVLSITKNKTPIKHNYILHGKTLEHVDKAKYLGVTIQSDLKWQSHVTNICNKANSTLGFLKRNLNINSSKIKEQAYKSLVRPSLEYACTVWDPYIKEDIDKVEMVQRRAARYVTNNYGTTSSVTDMLRSLNWRSLEDRRKDSRLTMLYKISNEQVAISKTDRLLPPLRQSRNMHPKSYQIPSCRTQVRKCSFFPRTIKDWNGLPLDVVLSDSLESFKSAISSHSYTH